MSKPRARKKNRGNGAGNNSRAARESPKQLPDKPRVLPVTPAFLSLAAGAVLLIVLLLFFLLRDRRVVLAVPGVELPTIRSWPMFNTYSLYAEYQLWFISSDISAGFINRLAFGVRIGLF
jgi:hypothetical protein